MPNPQQKANHITGVVSSIAAGTQAVLQIGPAKVTKIKLLRVKVRRSAGDGATFQPYVFSVVSSSVGALAQEFAAGVTTVATTPLSDNTAIDAYLVTDALGRLYLQFTPASGVNNAYTYDVWWEPLS